MATKLKNIFHIEYGNQADLNKMETARREDGVRFISRSSENLGFQCYVKRNEIFKLYKKGDITVTLGGSYLLSAFVQPGDFYTAQNIKVLSPREPMSAKYKFFYCYIISQNRYRYTTHGREANKTLDNLLVPAIDEIPSWVNKLAIPESPNSSPAHKKNVSLQDRKWKLFRVNELFDVKYGVNLELNKLEPISGGVPFVSRTSKNNGVSSHVKLVENITPNPPGTISVSGGGSVLECFLQDKPYYSGRDLYFLKPAISMSKLSLLFISTVIGKEKYRFSYGRQANKTLKSLLINLPIDNVGSPDWQFMDYYIKSLPYSINLSNSPEDGVFDHKATAKGFNNSD